MPLEELLKKCNLEYENKTREEALEMAKNKESYSRYITKDSLNLQDKNISNLPNKNIDGNFKDAKNRVTGKFELLGYDFSEWNNKTENGYGSQLFGPFVSGVNSKYDLPIGLTQDVKNLGVYINSSGNQSASIGFVVYDGGDAPASYGSAQHVIGNFNKEKNGQQVTATQPYLGDTPADSDFRTVEKEKSAAWVLDDVVYSETYKEI